MLRLDDLLDLCEQLEHLAGYSPTRTEEAAALFYALCFHEHVLGDARVQMPVRTFYVQISVSGLQLALHDIPRLRNLQDEIAAGDVTWEQARDWFERRLRSRMG
ncbi:hypothetical protein WMF30_16055 [Sorangium sp. So ce134]